MKNMYQANIWKFYLFKIMVVMELTLSVFVLFLLANNLTMFQVMILETIFTAVVFLLVVPTGSFADMYGRKIALALSSSLFCVSFIIYGLGTNFWIFLFANLVFAVGLAFMIGADSAFIYDTLKELKKENKYVRIYGRLNSILLFIYGGIALVSGILATHLGYRPLFFISAFFFFTGTIVALTLKEPPIHKKSLEKSYFKHLKEAIGFTINHRIVRNLIIYYSLFAAFTWLTYIIIQPYYDSSNLPKYVLGIAMSIYFTFAGLGCLCAEYFVKRFKEKKLLYSLFLIAAFSFIGMFFFNKIIALLFFASMSFVVGIRDIFIQKEIHIHTDSHHRASVISVQSMSRSMMYVVFAPILGLIMDAYSPDAAFLMIGVTMLIFFVFIAILFSKAKEKELKI